MFGIIEALGNWTISANTVSQYVALALVIIGCVAQMVASWLKMSDYVDNLCTAIKAVGVILIVIGVFIGLIYLANGGSNRQL